MTAPLKALIIDDDQDAANWLKYLVQSRFPALEVEVRLTPDASGDHDLYLVDNDFHGSCLAAELATSIRRVQPNSLVIAVSSCLDRDTLKQLLNLGCDGGFDKSDPEDLSRMSRIIDAFVQRRQLELGSDESRGFLGALRSIRELLRQWNQRLEQGHALLDADAASPVPQPNMNY